MLSAVSFLVALSSLAGTRPSSEDVAGAARELGEGLALLWRSLAAASFLAQPLPLKWMAGVDSALRMAPPQCWQVVGPWPVDAVHDLDLAGRTAVHR